MENDESIVFEDTVENWQERIDAGWGKCVVCQDFTIDERDYCIHADPTNADDEHWAWYDQPGSNED